MQYALSVRTNSKEGEVSVSPSAIRAMWCRLILAILGIVLIGADLWAQPVDLGAAPALAKPLTLRTARITLKELVREIAETVDITLGVAKEIENEKLTIFVDQCPASQVLQHVADVLQLEWREDKSKGGYYLLRSARIKEQIRKQAEAQITAVRQQIQNTLQEWQHQAQNDFSELHSRLVQINTAQERLETERPEGWQDRMTQLAQQRVNLVPAGESLSAYLIGWITARFGREQWSRFWQEVPFLAEYPLHGNAIELPQEVLAWFALQQPAKIRDLSIRSVRFLFYLKDGTLYTFLMVQTDQEQFVRPESFAFENPAFPTSSTKPDDSIPTLKIEDKGAPRLNCPYYGGVCTLAEHFEWLSERCKIEIIAESFRLPARLTIPPRVETLPEWVQQITQSEPVDIQYRDGFLLGCYINGGRWRQSEIEEALLVSFERRADENGGLSLDDFADLANLLTRSQQERFEQTNQIAVRFDPTPLQQGIPVLRFWANLTPAQRQSAFERQALSVSQMTHTQQRLYWDALEWGLTNPQLLTPKFLERIDDLYTPEGSAELAFFLDDWKQNTYSVSNGELTIVFEDETSYRESLVHLPAGSRPYSVVEQLRHEYLFHLGFDSQHSVICPVVISTKAPPKNSQ